MQLSHAGEHYCGQSGILDLVEDLGSALRANPDLLMMAGGNPGRIPQAERLFRSTLQEVLADDARSHQLLGRYQGPKGDLAVREALAAELRRHYGWPVGAEHVAVTNGGQSAFGLLATLLAGESRAGQRCLHVPLVPEYLGYADIGRGPGFFTAARPVIDLLPERQFKYRLDRSAPIPASAAALCVSRPTNPSGNVLAREDLLWLDTAARQRGIPLVIDAAYGLPFPGLQYAEDSEPYWSDNVILLLSLSKVGLPGIRSGFLVAAPDVIEAFSRANTVLNLASGNLGPALALPLLESGRLFGLAREVLQPWYRARRDHAVAALQAALGDLPWLLHRPEGAFFLWLWFPGLTIPCAALYQRLRAAGLLVVPGAASFMGLEEPWSHATQCIRLSCAVPDSTLERGAQVLASVVAELSP